MSALPHRGTLNAHASSLRALADELDIAAQSGDHEPLPERARQTLFGHLRSLGATTEFLASILQHDTGLQLLHAAIVLRKKVGTP